MNQRFESLDEWAKKVKEGNWKKIHTDFIDSQFQKAEKIMKKLTAEKIIKIHKIKNIKGYEGLLNKNLKKKHEKF